MFYEQELRDFEEKLREEQNKTQNILKTADAAIIICSQTLGNLRARIEKYKFKSSKEEVLFFKKIKPKPLSFLIHYTEVRSCEMKLPKWGMAPKFAFIDVEIQRINSFYDHHLDFQMYMETRGTKSDERYFTRKYLNDSPITSTYPYFRDPIFNTSHDELWATIKGLGLYGNYLKGLNARLNSKSKIPHNQKIEVPYKFTMSPTAAMEFIYAFKELRAFNNGNFEIKPFTDYFCKVFGIEIKDPYGLFAQITNRKTNRAKYIQKLLDTFLHSLDRRDEYS